MIVDLSRPNPIGYGCQGCSGRQLAPRPGMGAITMPSFDLSQIDWRWIVGLAIAGFLIWKFMRRGSSGSAKRKELRLARAKYALEAAKIAGA